MIRPVIHSTRARAIARLYDEDASISTRSRRANQFVLPPEDPYSDAASNIRSGDSCRQQSYKSPRQFRRTQHRRNSVSDDYRDAHSRSGLRPRDQGYKRTRCYGTYFFDRDPTHFRYILNYLRTGIFYDPDNDLAKQELLLEAKYYNVLHIVDQLDPPFSKESTILPYIRRFSNRGFRKMESVLTIGS